MSDRPRFIFLACQPGAEDVLKAEVARQEPDLRLAFSRPGLLTYKLPDDRRLHADFDLKLTFARAWGFSLGHVVGSDPRQMARDAWSVIGPRPLRRVHVWARCPQFASPTQFDGDIAGQGQGEPEATALDATRPDADTTVQLADAEDQQSGGNRPGLDGKRETTEVPEGIQRWIGPDERTAHESLLAEKPEEVGDLAVGADDPLALARRGEFVLDCIIDPLPATADDGTDGSGIDDDQVETPHSAAFGDSPHPGRPMRWWLGYHRALRPPTIWPGGIPPLDLPPEAVSRAWLKTEEALRWSRFPLHEGARVAEIGCAPGGSSQVLLARGYEVLGIDPAEMAPAVADHPRFRHLRRRASQTRRREFRKTRWLFADMNVAPDYTLQVVEDIVMHPQVRIRGLLLTLKLPEWHLAEGLPDCAKRVSSWGFNKVAVRHLAHNHREVCLAALKQPFRRR